MDRENNAHLSQYLRALRELSRARRKGQKPHPHAQATTRAWVDPTIDPPVWEDEEPAAPAQE